MSEFAFFRFMSNNMLTTEEQQHEDVLRVKGIECDSKISKISEEELKEVLREMRKLRKKRKEEENKDRLEEIDIAVH